MRIGKAREIKGWRRVTSSVEGDNLGEGERAGWDSFINRARGGLRAPWTVSVTPGGAGPGAALIGIITHLVERAIRPPALGLYHHIGM